MREKPLFRTAKIRGKKKAAEAGGRYMSIYLNLICMILGMARSPLGSPALMVREA